MKVWYMYGTLTLPHARLLSTLQHKSWLVGWMAMHSNSVGAGSASHAFQLCWFWDTVPACKQLPAYFWMPAGMHTGLSVHAYESATINATGMPPPAAVW
jgi:hypothetical protein